MAHLSRSGIGGRQMETTNNDIIFEKETVRKVTWRLIPSDSFPDGALSARVPRSREHWHGSLANESRHGISPQVVGLATSKAARIATFKAAA
jgi:hypothetical protein